MFLDFVLWITQPKTLDAILLTTQSHNFIFGVMAQDALDRIASCFRYVNEKKPFLKRDHPITPSRYGPLSDCASIGERLPIMREVYADNDSVSQIQVYLY